MERFDLGMIRQKLLTLTWGGGLTRDEIRHHWHGMPEHIYDVLPKDYVFRNAGEAMSYFEHLVRRGVIGSLGITGDDPKKYEPTLGQVTHRPKEHGVGSGADPGYTGGGSVQTGVGSSGTTYGDTEEPLK